MDLGKRVLDLWNNWEIRTMVLLSLSLQVILMMSGSKRKHIVTTWLRVLIWLAYLSADTVATIVLGNIARSEGEAKEFPKKSKNLIQAFWAPFLLLHLGGPDTITAYAREDSELWLRHLLGLGVQVGLSFYIFIRSWRDNKLLYLAIPMFVAGIIKYGERTYALYSTTSSSIKDVLHSVPPSLKPEGDQLTSATSSSIIEVLHSVPTSLKSEGEPEGDQLTAATSSSIKDALHSVPPSLKSEEEPEGDQLTAEVMFVPRESHIPRNDYLSQAYYLMRMSIFLFEDLSLGLSELKDSYKIISLVESPKKAYELIEVELGLIYDIFYTKAAIAYSSLGIFLRCISFLSSLITLVLFSVIIEKEAYWVIDVDITYFLLIGALVLEVYAFFHLILSDWAMLLYFNPYDFKNPPTNGDHVAIYSRHKYFSRGKRWSGSIAQYDLISSCFEIDLPECLKSFGMDKMMKHVYIKWKHADEHMKGLIFIHLIEKGKQIMDNLHNKNLRNELVNQRGNGVLERMNRDFASQLQMVENLVDDIKSINELEYSHSLLIWHIATELCYYDNYNSTHVNNLSQECKISKCLSDYLLYLLVFRSSMLPKGIVDVINDAKSRYENARKDVRKFFGSRRSVSVRDACTELLQNDPKTLQRAISNSTVMSGTAPRASDEAKAISKHKLVDGCKLARKLNQLSSELKWKIISQVWIEMLAYAASHCEWKEHAQQLRRGGELLTHVCLLMAHLGLSKQYRQVSIDEKEMFGN